MVEKEHDTGADVSEPRAADVGARGERRRSQAVVVIHGMGEQRPMGTIRGFGDAVWSRDLGLTPSWSSKRTVDAVTGEPVNRSWIVPDSRAGSHELRRITTVADIHGRRADFYEIYWADLTQDNRLGHLIGWVKGLLLRRWSDVPADARRLYVALWIVSLVSVLPAMVLWVLGLAGAERFILPAAAWSVAAAAVAYGVTSWVLPVYGDVATYVQAEPGTVAKRAQVRERALVMLERLMVDPAYDRIVLVGHSLGSIIAYDVLQILWAKYGPNHRNPRREQAVTEALRAFDDYASPARLKGGGTHLLPPDERPAFRAAQWRLYMALRDAPPESLPWRISDFVTLGSPLSHAEFLVAANAGRWRKGVEERLFSVCPPISDSETRRTIVYKDTHAHHAAVFSATRWTNIHDIGNRWSTGDPFSGAMTENFYGGVEEHRVELRWKCWGPLSRVMTHTAYWSDRARGVEIEAESRFAGRTHIEVLRAAVDLRRELEPASQQEAGGRD